MTCTTTVHQNSTVRLNAAIGYNMDNGERDSVSTFVIENILVSAYGDETVLKSAIQTQGLNGGFGTLHVFTLAWRWHGRNRRIGPTKRVSLKFEVSSRHSNEM